MPVIRYRQATVADAASIADLHARSWRTTYRGSYRDEYLDGPLDQERRDVWTGRLSEPMPNQLVVVAEDEGRIVGFACAYGAHDADGSFLDNLHADPHRHGERIGSGLFRTVVDWCRANYAGCGLHLKVFAQNTRARRFYEGLGAIDRGGTPPSSPWAVEGAEVRQYVWPTLETVSAPRRA